MKKTIIILALIASSYGTTIIGNQPYCKVNQQGTLAMCFYMTMQICLMSIYGGEFCVKR
jgi:hypothetical protein